MMKSTTLIILIAGLTGGYGFSLSSIKTSSLKQYDDPTVSPQTSGRREFLSAGVGLGLLTLIPKDANASGGATAGKYTTIPIAKRRYYGRVQQGELLQTESLKNKNSKHKLLSDQIHMRFSQNFLSFSLSHQLCMSF
jgi:hypothetical protein